MNAVSYLFIRIRKIAFAALKNFLQNSLFRNGISMDLELEGLLDKLARACRILEMEGHGDMTLGHVSMRDPH
ncbi:MAG: class II aldolase/adducin family protein, partial [Pigmentiphaga sp.]|nr:class II aldolase/adducin family protein [Pigmentiphaga sp.]